MQVAPRKTAVPRRVCICSRFANKCTSSASSNPARGKMAAGVKLGSPQLWALMRIKAASANRLAERAPWRSARFDSTRMLASSW